MAVSSRLTDFFGNKKGSRKGRRERKERKYPILIFQQLCALCERLCRLFPKYV